MVKKILIIFFLLLLLLAFFSPRIATWQVQRTLRHHFKDADISIGSLSIERPLSAALSNIEIKNRLYEIKIKKVSFDATLKMVVLEPHVKLKGLSKEWFSKNKPAVKNLSNKILFRTIEIRDLDLQCKTPDLITDVHGSLELDLQNVRINSASLSSDSLKAGELSLEYIVLDISNVAAGKLSIGKLSYNKLKIKDIQGKVIAGNKTLRIEPLTASVINGNVNGFLNVTIADGFAYQAAFNLSALDMDTITKDFDLEKKMSAEGKLAGKINLRGDLSGIKELSGGLSSSEAGGNLIIRDQDFLNYLAQNVHQPIELVEAGFKEYPFDSATVSLGMHGQDLNLVVSLNGQKGKRNFDIKLHDVFYNGG